MSDPTPIAKKLKRSALLHYINVDFTTTAASATWKLIGKDVEDMSVELNPQMDTRRNILDETRAVDNGYEPSMSVDTYYAQPDTASTPEGKLYAKVKDIMMNRKTGDDCRTLVMGVIIDQTGTTFDAWVEEAIVKPQSYGGAQGGVSIPFNISFDGNRVKGTATYENLSDPDKAKTITPTFAT
ncbi:MAG: hypothetical protein IIZ07_05570 [Ruminococcus sp.]|nr:hypothetical protein [Ruminococcus sp.]